MNRSEATILQSVSCEQFLDSLPGIFYLFDKQGKFLAWNDSFLRVSEYSNDEMAELHPLDLFSGNEKDLVASRIEETFRSGISSVEARLVSKSGRSIPHLFSGTRLMIDGEPYLCGMGLDISESKHIEDQLIYMNQEYLLQASALNATQNAVFITNKNGNIQWVNKAFEEMTGYTKDEAKGKTPEILNSGVQDCSYYKNLWDTILSGKHWQGELVNRRKNGELYIEEEFITPIQDENNNISHFIAIKQDITERKIQETKIHRLNRIYNVLSSINTLIVRVPGRDELFRESVRIAVEHGEFDLAIVDIYSDNLDSISFSTGSAKNLNDLEEYKNAEMAKILSGSGLISQAIRTQKSCYSNNIAGEEIPGSNRRRVAIQLGFKSMISLPLIVESQVIAVLSLLSKEEDFFDQDELKLLYELQADISFSLNHLQTTMEARFLSQFNPVTGLPNRKNFLEKIEAKLQKNTNKEKRGILIVFDIERFRNINSRLGRSKGDTILQTIKDRFSNFPYREYMLGHLERDHFSLFMEGDFSSSDLIHILNDIKNVCFAEPFSIDEIDHHLTGRFGISHFPQDASDGDRLLKYAEDARNKAKISKEHYAFYSAEMNAKVFKEQILENQLRQALARNEFEFYYQPKYNAFTGKITGCESLIRWKNNSGNYIGPDVFIPIMEEMGIIQDVGILAIENAIEKYKKWMEMGLNPPRIAVNISAVQFGHKDFRKNVESLLLRKCPEKKIAGLDFEITENSMMNNIDATVQAIESFRNLGIKIAIDDFGTGYSSLNYIARLPFDSLKIDKSFVFSMQENPADMTIVSTIINLAHQLGLNVIAEGVEKEEQADLLKQLKCNEFQGYLYCRPIPEDAFIELLRKNIP